MVSTVHVNVDEAKFSTGPFDAPQLFHVGSVGFSLHVNLSMSTGEQFSHAHSEELSQGTWKVVVISQ